MIETKPREQWVVLNQDDAKLYIFSMDDGWRLPSFAEAICLPLHLLTIPPHWNTDNINQQLYGLFSPRRFLIPVRDIKDD